MRSVSLRIGAIAAAALAMGIVVVMSVAQRAPVTATLRASLQNAAPPGPPPCTLRVPDDPLSAQGLATPWVLGGGAQCHESDPATAAFVQAAVVTPTGQVAVYDPLVIDRGTRPAEAPTVPELPAGGVVGVWVGYNGNNLVLRGEGSERCVQGVGASTFGQNVFCNAAAFFATANNAVATGHLKVPALGTARDGRPCPTTRDFSVVDQDQSDNTTTLYLITADGTSAQDTPQNELLLGRQIASTVFNGSDEGLLATPLDKALGCTPWKAPDLADSTHAQQLSAQPLNELQAAADQPPPAALVPALDPFTLVNGDPNLAKLNAYRAAVDMPALNSLDQADTQTYCANLLRSGLPRIVQDRPFTEAAASPFPATANNLFTFLASRFHATFSNADGFLRCTHLLHVRNPVHLVTNSAGVVVSATVRINPRAAASAADETSDDV